MPYANKMKQNEYMKLLMRRRLHLKTDVPNKTILEQVNENLREPTVPSTKIFNQIFDDLQKRNPNVDGVRARDLIEELKKQGYLK